MMMLVTSRASRKSSVENVLDFERQFIRQAQAKNLLAKIQSTVRLETSKKLFYIEAAFSSLESA